jgi:hypothetical protein
MGTTKDERECAPLLQYLETKSEKQEEEEEKEE